MQPTASPLEVLWTVPAVAGTCVSLVLLYLSILDEVRRRQFGVNGVVRLDVQKSIVTAAVLTEVSLCLTVVGVLALATPPNPNLASDPTTAATVVVNSLLLLVVNVSLTGLAAYRLVQRGAVLREIRRGARRDRRATDRPQRDGALD